MGQVISKSCSSLRHQDSDKCCWSTEFQFTQPLWERGHRGDSRGCCWGKHPRDKAHSLWCGQRCPFILLLSLPPTCSFICHHPLTGCSLCPWSLHLAGCSLAAPSSVELPVPSPVLLYLQSPRMVFAALCLRPPGLEPP